MTIWAVQDAKARFSEFLETCLRDGPQVVTKRGAEAAVLVPVDQWRRLQQSARPTLKDLLLSENPAWTFRSPNAVSKVDASRRASIERRCICSTPT
jgi:antitoxin Phd